METRKTLMRIMRKSDELRTELERMRNQNEDAGVCWFELTRALGSFDNAAHEIDCALRLHNERDEKVTP